MRYLHESSDLFEPRPLRKWPILVGALGGLAIGTGLIANALNTHDPFGDILLVNVDLSLTTIGSLIGVSYEYNRQKNELDTYTNSL